MFRRIIQTFRGYDWLLLGAVILLLAFGLSALYSIATSSDQPDFSNFRKQIVFSLIGLALMFLTSAIDYRVWQNYSLPLYGVSLFLLIAVLLFGRTIRGTTGWFTIVGFNFQPVELAKLGLIAILAWILSRQAGAIRDRKTFFVCGAGLGVLFLLAAAQPDFGSAIVLVSIWIVMIVLAGATRGQLISLFLLALVSFTIGWFFLFHDYQRDRILSFLDPQADPYGRGYHVRQAVTAVGAGGVLGRGLGLGSQSQLKFIPASETDFIFAVIAEELGMVGAAVVLGLWGLLFYRLFRASRQVRDGFAVLFILGVSALFFCHVLINIGMNIGLLPVTGISLPFVSYGGSFLLISLVLVGIVQGMVVRNPGRQR